MKEIIIDEYSLKNPFEKSFFFDFSKNADEITWLEKNLFAHHNKLLRNVFTILEAQENIRIKEENAKQSLEMRRFDQLSMVIFLEYFYIKESTILELLDRLYMLCLDIDKKTKKSEIEKMIYQDMETFLKNDSKNGIFIREEIKSNIINIRNRIVHENGYSTRVFLNEGIYTFEIANSQNETILNYIDSVFSYYKLDNLIIEENEKIHFMHTRLLRLTNYVVYYYYILHRYIDIIHDLILKKANIDTNLDDFEKDWYSTLKYISFDDSLKLLSNKLSELDDLFATDDFKSYYFENIMST